MYMGGRKYGLFATVVALTVVVGGILLSSIEVDANGGVISKAKDLARGKSDPTEKMFNVKDFKAKGNGKAEDTLAFMQAWVAACQWNGKAKLVIPQGKYLLGQTIFQGPCKGPGPMIVDNQGILLGMEDPSVFTSDEWILFEDIDGLIIIGGGSFDGQGASVWEYSDCDTNENCQRMPVNVRFNRVKNAIIRRLSSVNAKGFHIALNFCDNVRLHNLKITAPDNSPNTDGIHISRSNMINIAKSDIGTGDDCVSMIQGCTNIRINKLNCGPGHGISVGSLGKYKDEIDVKGVIVKNCTLTNTDNGVRIKTWPDSPPSIASEIVFQDIVMNNVKNPIVIDQEYNYHGKSNIVPSRVKITDVRFINIKGTTISKMPVNVVCSKQFPCEKLQFHNINLKYTGGAPGTSKCLNTKGVILGGIQIPPICK